MKKTFNLFLMVVLTISAKSLLAQSPNYVVCVGFYNLENLFDTIDQDTHNDDDFTPLGRNNYTDKVYQGKLSQLSRVISEIGTELTPHGPALLGVAEIENRSVLEDLVAQESIADRDYRIVHFDSKDHRGIDVGLLYQSKYFKPRQSFVVPLITRQTDSTTWYSRDILFVIGRLAGEDVVISVNHWPSRRGGAAATAPLRNKAAMINDAVLDSLQETLGITKHIIMGDLNDDPTNDSVTKYLSAKDRKKKVQASDRYNPMCKYYKKGFGTTAWRDAWSLFDQVIFSSAWLEDPDGLQYYQAKVFNPPYLVQKSDRFKGYPFRTYSFGQHIGGFSDHFPVYAYLTKAASGS